MSSMRKAAARAHRRRVHRLVRPLAASISIAGNMLAGPQVLAATAAAYERARALPLPSGCFAR
jgi:uncharacterized Ntn-hydrolase superfamily protein